MCVCRTWKNMTRLLPDRYGSAVGTQASSTIVLASNSSLKHSAGHDSSAMHRRRLMAASRAGAAKATVWRTPASSSPSSCMSTSAASGVSSSNSASTQPLMRTKRRFHSQTPRCWGAGEHGGQRQGETELRYIHAPQVKPHRFLQPHEESFHSGANAAGVLSLALCRTHGHT